MSKVKHPIGQEELMAYLDGELETDRAVEAAAHLERCAECQEFAAEIKKISRELMAWEAEPAESAGLPTDIAGALEMPQKKVKKAANRPSWGALLTPRRLMWAGGVGVLVVMVFLIPNLRRDSRFSKESPRVRQDAITAQLAPAPPPSSPTGSVAYNSLSNPAESFKIRDGKGLLAAPTPAPSEEDAYVYDSSGRLQKTEGEAGDEIASKPEAPKVPMIARTAGLTLVTKEFDQTRGSVEEILKRHSGYFGEMTVSAPADSGRTLTAVLRIPAPQLDAALAELKKLGRVENESQGGEEVTAQYVDLEARLKNGQHTEQRLTEILRQRTGKLQDVLKVELEIDRVRGEIEQMQGEKKELAKRVAFATLNATVKEEYQAKLQPAPPSTGNRFRNAAVDGYNTVVEGFISIGLFLLSSGPSLLIWAAVLFFPVRWAWRKIRAELKKSHEEATE